HPSTSHIHPLALDLPLFFFYCSRDHRALHSFPTRRSSDLGSSAVSAAPISVPLSIVPNVSMVTCAITGIRVFDCSKWSKIAASEDRKSTRLNSSHVKISYAVFCLKKKIQEEHKLEEYRSSL